MNGVRDARAVRVVAEKRRPVSWRRLLVAGLFVATAVGLAGGLLEWWWFGLSAAASGDRAERHVQRRFDGMVASLETVSLRIARDPSAATALSTAQDGARTLFDLTTTARQRSVRAPTRSPSRCTTRSSPPGPGPDVLLRFRAIELAVQGRCSSRGRRWGFGSFTFDRYRRQTADASARSPRSTSSRRRPRLKPSRPVTSRCPRPWRPPFSGCGTKCLKIRHARGTAASARRPVSCSSKPMSRRQLCLTSGSPGAAESPARSSSRAA